MKDSTKLNDETKDEVSFSEVEVDVWALKKKHITAISFKFSDAYYVLRYDLPVIQYTYNNDVKLSGDELKKRCRLEIAYKAVWPTPTFSKTFKVDCNSMKNKLDEFISSNKIQKSLVSQVRELFVCAGLVVKFSVSKNAPLYHKAIGSSESSSNLDIHQTYENLQHLLEQLKDKEEELQMDSEYTLESSNSMK